MNTKKSPFQCLIDELASLDLVVPGTLRTVYLCCGKSACPCASGKKEHRHGPYLFWDRKINGKLSSASIPRSLAPQFKRWIANRRRLDRIYYKLLELGAAAALKAKSTRN